MTTPASVRPAAVSSEANSSRPKQMATTAVEADSAMVRTLPELGLDRMTQSGIESQLCTSALTAHL